VPTNNITINYNELETYFRAHRDPVLQDVAFTACPGIDLLIARASDVRPSFRSTSKLLQYKAKRMAQKGRLVKGAMHYEVPVRLNKLTGVVKQSGAGVAAISNSPVDDTTPARWEFSEYYFPVAISQAKWAAAKSGGSKEAVAGAMLSLIGDKTKSMYQDLIEELASDLYGTNTSSSSGLFSISAGVGNSAVDTTTYGNISRSTYTAWCGNYTARTLSAIATLTSADYILAAMRADSQTAIANGANPNALVYLVPTNIHSAVWDAYTGLNGASTSSLLGRFDLKEGAGLPDIQFDGLTFGKIPIVHDPNIPASKMILLDTETSYFVGLNGAVFDMEKWAMAETSTQFYSRCIFIGQFVVTNPRRNVISVYS